MGRMGTGSAVSGLARGSSRQRHREGGRIRSGRELAAVLGKVPGPCWARVLAPRSAQMLEWKWGLTLARKSAAQLARARTPCRRTRESDSQCQPSTSIPARTVDTCPPHRSQHRFPTCPAQHPVDRLCSAVPSVSGSVPTRARASAPESESAWRRKRHLRRIGRGTRVGGTDGAGVGAAVGKDVGAGIGAADGVGVGAVVGSGMGDDVGREEGPGIGIDVGAGLGADVGSDVGSAMLVGHPGMSCTCAANSAST